MDNLPVVKFIVTDDYKPLHAMKKVFGPPSGPIKNPTRVRVDIIGELLKQYNAPQLFEVIPVSTKPNGVVVYSDRVELTLGNYRESWYTISGMEIPAVGLGDAVKAPVADEPPVDDEPPVGDEAPVGDEPPVEDEAPVEVESDDDEPGTEEANGQELDIDPSMVAKILEDNGADVAAATAETTPDARKSKGKKGR